MKKTHFSNRVVIGTADPSHTLTSNVGYLIFCSIASIKLLITGNIIYLQIHIDCNILEF